MSKLTDTMLEVLNNRISEIKQYSLSEILAMPAYSDKEIANINTKSFTLATWKNQRDDGNVEIIVQAYYAGWCYRLFGAGTMMADGFLIDSQGKILPLPDEIRWEYC